MGFFKKLFGGTPASTQGVRAEESIEALHEEFCRTFCHRPGVNFMAILQADGATRLIEWLQPSTPCALPKGFVRLAVDGTRRGIKFWEQPGITMVYEGNWSNGGLPPQESQDALSVLAQILGKPIKLYYQQQENGPQMVKEFEP
jgi:hypothetical protein